MGSAVIYEDEDALDDGTRYEMIATAIPTSDDYPEGVIVIAVTVYQYDRMTACGQSGNDLQGLVEPPAVSG